MTMSRSLAALIPGMALLAGLLVVNLWLNPARFTPGNFGVLVGLASPLICAALAATPPILGGRGGIDVSIGPAMGFVNAVLVVILIGWADVASPFLILPAALALGGAIGLINGCLATIVRIQPIIATLGSYLVLTGLTVTLVPAPIGVIPEWWRSMGHGFSLAPIVVIALIWSIFVRRPVYGQLMAVGSDDRAAFTAGVNVVAVRLIAYTLSGAFAGVASLSLTALIGSADPNVGPPYTLLAISSVALGGVSLAGGRGGLLGAAIGGLNIFLLQSVLTFFNVSTFVLQVAYGAILVAAVSFSPLQERLTRGAR
jgi:ribose transport system permease protein